MTHVYLRVLSPHRPYQELYQVFSGKGLKSGKDGEERGNGGK